jgi:saccharopine dehydrogenase (NADP+, L-glutamate forming)
VLLALRNSAKYIDKGKVVEIPGHLLMSSAKPIPIYPAFAFVGYPNRDSTPYQERYSIPECQTVLRGTLRYSVFPGFVKVLVLLGFLNDDPVKELDESNKEPLSWKSVLAKALDTIPEEASLIKTILDKTGLQGEESDYIIYGLKWLGLFSDTIVSKKGNLLDTLCATLEEKMQYGPGERDMVMLQHKVC